MRLIDIDKIEINEKCIFSGKGIKDFLDAIPTAYDVDVSLGSIIRHNKICAFPLIGN